MRQFSTCTDETNMYERRDTCNKSNDWNWFRNCLVWSDSCNMGRLNGLAQQWDICLATRTWVIFLWQNLAINWISWFYACTRKCLRPISSNTPSMIEYQMKQLLDHYHGIFIAFQLKFKTCKTHFMVDMGVPILETTEHPTKWGGMLHVTKLPRNHGGNGMGGKVIVFSVWYLSDCRRLYVIGPHFPTSLQWRHNEHDGVSNHQPHDWLLSCLFGHRSKKTAKLRVTGLCEGNSPVTGEFPAQRASNAENVSIWWRHHAVHIMV